MAQNLKISDFDRLTYELGLLKWRRTLCSKLFATDVDEILSNYDTNMVVEYYNARPVVVIDYKSNEHWSLDTSIVVQWKLAFGVGVPMYVIVHCMDDEQRTFQRWAIHLTEVLGDRDFLDLWPGDLRAVATEAPMSEREFEAWLHELRGLTCCRDRLT